MSGGLPYDLGPVGNGGVPGITFLISKIAKAF
jgi:hypothetical protein